MAQIEKQECEVDIKSSAESFHRAFCYQQNMLPKMCPEFVQETQVIKGDGKSVGSITKWIYAPSSGDSPSSEFSLALTEAIDDKNNSITVRIIEGEINKMYSLYRCTIQVTGKGNGSSVKYTHEYQKINPDFPEPTKYLEFVDKFYKAIDAYLVKNSK